MDAFVCMLFVPLVYLVHKGDGLNQSCNFGYGCPFPCNCEDGLACNAVTGSCPADNCLVATPAEYGWRGHGCLTGNIAYGKKARQNGQFEDYNASLALDGNWTVPENVSDSITCAQPSPLAVPGPSCASDFDCPNAWWQVDLGTLYNIKRVVIHGSRIADERVKLNNIDIRVSKSAAVSGYDYQLCTWFRIATHHFQSNCYPAVVGQYLTVFKHERTKDPLDDLGRFTLCEVIIIGNLYNNCSDCAGTCTDQYGCVSCPSGLEPSSLCNEACGVGYFGENCKERCGMCRSLGVRTCHKSNGVCFDECDPWWTNDRCDVEIVPVRLSSNAIHIVSLGSTNITVRWNAIASISTNLSEHYGYGVYYKNSRSSKWLNIDIVEHLQKKIYLQSLENLKFNTSYDIKIVPFRTDRGQQDTGGPAFLMNVRTLCGDKCRPNLPGDAITNSPSRDTEKTLPRATTQIDSWCSGVFWGLYASSLVLLAFSVLVNIFLCIKIRRMKVRRHHSERVQMINTTRESDVAEPAPPTRRARAEPNDYIMTTSVAGGGLNIGEAESNMDDHVLDNNERQYLEMS